MPVDPFIGEIYMGGMNFAPNGFMSCSGQLLPINTYAALFSLLGTTFGGNGVNNFALPDLRGRMPMGQGSGPGLTPHNMGEISGQETVTLTTNELPAHNHAQYAVTDAGTTAVPTNAYLANTGALDKEYRPSGTLTPMNSGTIASAGGNQAHNNMPPYLVLNFYIAITGTFPSRN